MSSMPVTPMMPPPSATGPPIDQPGDASDPALMPTELPANIVTHIATLSPPGSGSIPAVPPEGTAPQSPIPLTPAEWSLLISKAQLGEVPAPHT